MDVNMRNNQCLKLHVIMKFKKLKNLFNIMCFKCKINFIIKLSYSIIQLKNIH
jgi:hypothetical protein